MSKNKKQLNKGKKIILTSLVLIAIFSFAKEKVSAKEITSDDVISLTNEARFKYGVGVVRENELLDKAAKEKARDMIEKNYFAHTSPEGIDPWHWIEKNNYDYHFAGENLAINFTDAKEQQKAWMESPSHKKNILNPKYQEIGVAVEKGIIDGHMTTVTVQMFGSQMNSVAGIEIQKDTVGVLQTSIINAENKNGIHVWFSVILLITTIFGLNVALIIRKHGRHTLLVAHE